MICVSNSVFCTWLTFEMGRNPKTETPQAIYLFDVAAAVSSIATSTTSSSWASRTAAAVRRNKNKRRKRRILRVIIIRIGRYTKSTCVICTDIFDPFTESIDGMNHSPRPWLDPPVTLRWSIPALRMLKWNCCLVIVVATTKAAKTKAVGGGGSYRLPI
jgi:hypothetical protein